MITRTRRALGPSGWRKFETPFEIASRPVSEDPPLAKALSTMMIPAPYRRPLPGVPSGTTPRKMDRVGVQLTEGGPDDADDDQGSGRGDEEVGRDSEDVRPASRIPRRLP